MALLAGPSLAAAPEVETSCSSAPCPPMWHWPQDYETLDSGQLLVRRDFLPLFRARGWDTYEGFWTADCELVRRIAQRENCRLQLPDPCGPGTITGYLKRHRSSCMREWLAACLTGRPWLPPGRFEAEAVGWCQGAGVPTMAVIAAGQRFGKRPWQADSFFLSEQVPGEPADDYWKNQLVTTPNALRRQAVLAGLAHTAQRFHRAGLFHRDFYWCHFLVAEDRPGGATAYLIDLQRVLRSRWLSWRWLIKDLAQFRFSIPAGLVTDDEARTWWQHYVGQTQPSWRARSLAAVIALRAWFYWWKDGRS